MWWLEEEENRGFGTAAVAGVALGKSEISQKGKWIFSYFGNFQIALRKTETPAEGFGKVRLVRLF